MQGCELCCVWLQLVHVTWCECAVRVQSLNSRRLLHAVPPPPPFWTEVPTMEDVPAMPETTITYDVRPTSCPAVQ